MRCHLSQALPGQQAGGCPWPWRHSSLPSLASSGLAPPLVASQCLRRVAAGLPLWRGLLAQRRHQCLAQLRRLPCVPSCRCLTPWVGVGSPECTQRGAAWPQCQAARPACALPWWRHRPRSSTEGCQRNGRPARRHSIGAWHLLCCGRNSAVGSITGLQWRCCLLWHAWDASQRYSNLHRSARNTRQFSTQGKQKRFQHLLEARSKLQSVGFTGFSSSFGHNFRKGLGCLFVRAVGLQHRPQRFGSGARPEHRRAEDRERR
mmetsp:Transcript_16643/g.52405  ORF Transcript_16643/g.52405 Transcript_16643/m.52405 type:complete len:261 (-) Transcript_16643:67-849(-)